MLDDDDEFAPPFEEFDDCELLELFPPPELLVLVEVLLFEELAELVEELLLFDELVLLVDELEFTLEEDEQR